MIVDAIQSVWDTAATMQPEVIVVDNGSTDGSVAAIKQQFGEQVRCIELGHNAGFAAANNAGIRAAQGDYMLLLNPDTIVLEGALQAMTDYMDHHPEAGACGANLFDREMQPQFSYWMLLPGWRMEWHGLFSNCFLRLKHHGSHEHNMTNQPKEVGYIMGADLMVRRQVLDQVGLMDEDFFLFYEETELCYRIHRAGYPIVNIPQAHIIHLEGQTIDKLNVRLEQMMRSRAIYLHKCCSAVERFAANTILAVNSLLRTVWFALSGNKQKVEFWKYTLHHL